MSGHFSLKKNEIAPQGLLVKLFKKFVGWVGGALPARSSLYTFFKESDNGFCRAFYHKKRSGGGGDGGGWLHQKNKKEKPL